MLTPTDVSHRHMTITELIAHSLRLRPGQIIVGEAHGTETVALRDALSIQPHGSGMTFYPGMPKQL